MYTLSPPTHKIKIFTPPAHHFTPPVHHFTPPAHHFTQPAVNKNNKNSIMVTSKVLLHLYLSSANLKRNKRHQKSMRHREPRMYQCKRVSPPVLIHMYLLRYKTFSHRCLLITRVNKKIPRRCAYNIQKVVNFSPPVT